MQPAMTTMKNQGVIIYLRVSTEEQVENYSLDTQEDICRKEAQRRKLEVIQVFREEGRSAKTIKGRPVLIEMLEFCRKHKRNVDVVIVYRLDRISRQIADYLAIRKKLAECEIALVSATEPTGNTPTEKFVETMLAGFAQMDNDVRSERSKNGMRARFKAGLPNGKVPIGYITKNGYATKDPECFDKVKAAWELMATGTKTLREMAELLNSQGVRENVRGMEGYRLRMQTMGRAFRSKFYAGKLISKQYGEEVQGQHTPMVTEEQFYRVQAVLDGRNTNLRSSVTKRNPNNQAFPLRRIVKCGRCGTSFTGAWSRGKAARYAYYFCKKRCGVGSSVPTKTLEEATNELVATMSLKSETVELLNAFLRKTYVLRISSLQKRRAEADNELKKVHEFRQALIEKNVSGVFSDDIFKEQNRMLEDKIQTIQIAKSDAVIDKYNLEDISTFIENKLGHLSETYKTALLDQKRVLLCSIFDAGLRWNYTGYSNTKIAPFYRAILSLQQKCVSFGDPTGSRTPVYRMKTCCPNR